ncbi:hypothetical protein CRD_02072 [Raphidiopsis brookii D9]|nr:hypothetical protein CRD_02072 [Raphidiopsis brookii D9]
MFTIPERQSWMSTLARAELQQLEDLIESLVTNFHDLPNYTFLRNPEIGLVMVQGRAGATGKAFNLGDMTITRCVVQLKDMVDGLPISGFGYIGGRSQRHAELAALCDALLQTTLWHDQVQTTVILPIQQSLAKQQDRKQRQTAATKVNFFTMVRGEG